MSSVTATSTSATTQPSKDITTNDNNNKPVETPSVQSIAKFEQALTGDTPPKQPTPNNAEKTETAPEPAPTSAPTPNKVAEQAIKPAPPATTTTPKVDPNKLDTPESYAAWRAERLQATGKTELDDSDLQELAKESIAKLNQRTNDEAYSPTGADRASMSLRDTYNNLSEFSSYSASPPQYDTKQFLQELPDAYYHALRPATGQELKTADMKALINEYAQLQPDHQNPETKARLDAINQQLKPYREAYNHQYATEELSESGSYTTYGERINYRFETSHADFKTEASKDIKVPSPQGGHNVAGGELLAAIDENTRHGHTAGADNNKNGAFDPTKDNKGLSGFVNGLIENVIDNPLIRTVAKVAQFIPPFAPVATVVNGVIAAHDAVQAFEDGDIAGVITNAASTATGIGKITHSNQLLTIGKTTNQIGTVATAIKDPSATNLLNVAADATGHSNTTVNTALDISRARDAALADDKVGTFTHLLRAGSTTTNEEHPDTSKQLTDSAKIIDGIDSVRKGDVVGVFSNFSDMDVVGVFSNFSDMVDFPTVAPPTTMVTKLTDDNPFAYIDDPLYQNNGNTTPWQENPAVPLNARIMYLGDGGIGNVNSFDSFAGAQGNTGQVGNFSGIKPFAWHFEDRAELNGAPPSYAEVTAENSQWSKLPPSQSIYHDNNVGSPEVKYIHPDGREAVFSADMTGYYEPYIDPRYIATFNYVNPPPFPEWYDVGGYLDVYFYGQGHLMFDVLPYMIGGNVRGDN